MITLIYVAALVLSVVLAFMPWLIYNELKRQGAERREEALKVISLLASLARRSPEAELFDPDSAARLQALADAKALSATAVDA